jgi:hypothetical protein
MDNITYHYGKMSRRTRFDRLRDDLRRAELASQLEDLVLHVMNCERWARFDDRLDLALAVERERPVARPREQ